MNEERLQLLIDTGLLLASERSLDVIVGSALAAGSRLSGAAFGAFLYNNIAPDGEPYQLARYIGLERRGLGHLVSPRSLPAADKLATPGADGQLRQVVRFDDVLAEPDLGPTQPYFGLAPGEVQIRSYLVVAVRSRGGEILGHMVYGHPDPGVFSADIEPLLATVSSQAAVAIDNTRLAETLTREIAIADAARRLQREAADRLTEVFEATTDAVFLLDRDWRFTYLNRRAVDLIAEGRPLVGRNIWEAFPQAVGTQFEQKYSSVMKGEGRSEFTEFYPPLNTWFYVRAFPTAEGVAVFFRDITQERAAEREREESARRLRQALDAGALGTWEWDARTDMLDFDERAAAIFHVLPHQPLSRSALRSSLVHHDDMSQTPESFTQFLAGNGHYHAEYRIELEDGSQRWISARGLASFRANSTEVAGMVGTIQDITARKAQEATLRQSEKLAATGRLAATIAHEINNPLEAVTNLIYICKTDPSVPTPIQRLLETADGELARVAQIAQQTLGFYRDTTRPVDIDLNELLSAVVDLFSRKLRYKGLTAKLDLSPDLHIHGLQGEIRQVFSNLVVNAIDASSKSSIRIRARRIRQGGVPGVSVVIADCGSGIPQGVRQRLFSPFFTTKESIGTGLGLWVTRGIIEKQGGTIAFRTSTQAPSGTVFRVFLPAEARNPEIFAVPESQFVQ